VYAGGPAASPTLRAPDRPITIADLLTHTSGLTYGAFGNTAVDSIYGRAGINSPAHTIAFFADSIAKLPLLYSPGTAWTYSLAIDVLGRVVEVASGKTFDRYLEDEIFAPLGMHTTAFHATPAMEGKITTVYSRTQAGLRAGVPLLGAGYRSEGKAFMGGQGLLSTIPDYLRFAQMLLNGGELDGRRILARETVALMMQNHLPPSLTPLRSQPGYGFGYGGAVRVAPSTAASPESIGTFRWSGLASTFFWIDPKTDMIGMVWAQVTPTLGPLQADFQRLVYAAVTDR
jgi:CubicO group peptidase (beta-lactamase class C family)